MSEQNSNVIITQKIYIIFHYLVKNTKYFEQGIDIDTNEIIRYFNDVNEINEILNAMQIEGYIRESGGYFLTLKGIMYYQAHYIKNN